MTHMYFTARAEGRISYGHLGHTNLFFFIQAPLLDSEDKPIFGR